MNLGWIRVPDFICERCERSHHGRRSVDVEARTNDDFARSSNGSAAGGNAPDRQHPNRPGLAARCKQGVRGACAAIRAWRVWGAHGDRELVFQPGAFVGPVDHVQLVLQAFQVGERGARREKLVLGIQDLEIVLPVLRGEELIMLVTVSETPCRTDVPQGAVLVRIEGAGRQHLSPVGGERKAELSLASFPENISRRHGFFLL